MRQSTRGQVAPFIVMDVMEAARQAEAAGRRIVHMEVGQPATPAPAVARRALAAALDQPLGYTVALGLPALREAISADIGFHAHNNLGVGIANALTAAENGAEHRTDIQTLVIILQRTEQCLCALRLLRVLAQCADQHWQSGLDRRFGRAGIHSELLADLLLGLSHSAEHVEDVHHGAVLLW